jgi:phosphate transport system permease protein
MAGKIYASICISIIIVILVVMTWFIASKGLALFLEDKINIFQFLTGTQWKPDRGIEEGGQLFGAFPFLVGSFSITALAILISTPLSVGSAIFMAEINPKRGRSFLQPIIELLVGIPSVVYGYIGLSVIVPFIRSTGNGIGFSLIAGVIVLSVMIIPTITSVSYDAVKSLPESYKQASYALGATRWQTIKNVLIPAGMSNILTGVVLGMSRAFGEALAVQMVIGNTTVLPDEIFDSTSTLTSIITLEMGNTITGTAWNNALWSMALILLIMSFMFIFIIRFLGREKNK